MVSKSVLSASFCLHMNTQRYESAERTASSILAFVAPLRLSPHALKMLGVSSRHQINENVTVIYSPMVKIVPQPPARTPFIYHDDLSEPGEDGSMTCVPFQF